MLCVIMPGLNIFSMVSTSATKNAIKLGNSVPNEMVIAITIARKNQILQTFSNLNLISTSASEVPTRIATIIEMKDIPGCKSGLSPIAVSLNSKLIMPLASTFSFIPRFIMPKPINCASTKNMRSRTVTLMVCFITSYFFSYF